MRRNIFFIFRYKSGQNHLTDFIGIEPSKKRKRRTSFTPQALELLNAHFERNTHPSGKNSFKCINQNNELLLGLEINAFLNKLMH